jgi:CheY-like chemotaxis protein
LRFEVADTGVGIPEATLARLFQAFSQADSSTSRRFGGSGLGLSISKKLVELMSGEIGAVSDPGAGSTFWFSLPLPAPEPESGEEAIGPSSPRVLLLEGYETERKAIRYLLLRRKIEFFEAPDRGEALNELRRAAREGRPFDIALIDHEALGADGLALGGQLKADPLLNRTRLVLLTSFADRKTGKLALRQGFYSSLAKPFKQAALFECLDLTNIPDRPAPANSEPKSSSRVKNGLRILIVEDNLVNQRIALKMLENLGYGTDIAANGHEAIAAVLRNSYDAVLMDCQMPEMDGFETTREIRKLEAAGVRLPIIALTANAMSGDRDLCLKAGMDDYLAKPIDLQQLDQVLSAWTRSDVGSLSNIVLKS